ncbi:uncharacterized protein [Drosophila takahashii]
MIIGGIYNITFVRRPDQTQFEKFNIVLHEDGRVLKVIADVVAEVDGRSSHISEFTRMTFRGSQMKLGDDELPFFVVTVKLPPDLCRWGKPVVCHYLREVEAPPRTPDRNTLVTLNIIDPQRISSQLTQTGESGNRSIANQFNPTLRSFLKHSVSYAHILEKGMPIKDFPLDKALNKIEIMKLEKMCLPRIISSFKLPSEFTEDNLTAEALKSKPNRLLKRTETEMAVETKPPTENFDYEMQERPERMFPIFEKATPLEFVPSEYSTPTDSTKITTACGLLATLEDIKEKYVHKPFQLLDQIEIVPKKLEKKNAEGSKSASNLNPSRSSDRRSFTDVNDRKSVTDARDRKSITDGNLKFKSSGSDQKIGKNRDSDQPRGSEHKTTRRSGSVSKRRSTRKSGKVEDLSKFRQEEKEPPVLLDHWTKEHIIESTNDQVTNTLTFRTTRLGIFGLAFKRYEHFPFGDWCLQPNEDNPDEIILSLDTFHVRMFFYITSQGVRGYVTDLTKGYTAKPVKYLEIVEPISDFRVLRKLLVEKNLNIFAENDASYYIKNGYFSVKHVATELHTYNTMALQCKLMKFNRSSWNRLATRRDIIMDMKIAKDNTDYTEVTMRITPEKTTFVKVSEMCSDDIKVVKLRYEETWRNVNNYNDFGQAIQSLNPHAQEGSNKEAMLFVYIKRLLNEIRPLSYS